jgi:hypothetical protein
MMGTVILDDAVAFATAMAWHLAGRPRRDSLPAQDRPGTCTVCGAHVSQTVPARLTAGNKTFTDQHLLAARSDVTCYPCAWVMAGKPPHALRMWTVACAPGRDLGPCNPKQVITDRPRPGLLLTARDDMRQVARLLCSPPAGPWCAAVAETGQKHTLPWTPVNHGGGRWQVRMDQADVVSDPAEFAALLSRSAVLRKAGFTGDEISSMDPNVAKLTAERLPLWAQQAPHLMPYKDSAVLRLANFMIKKEHYDEYRGYLTA